MTATGDCVTGPPGSCPSDNLYMYIYWIIYAVFLVVNIVSFKFAYNYILSKTLSSKSNAPKDESGESAHSNPVSNMSSTASLVDEEDEKSASSTYDVLLSRMDLVPALIQMLLLVLSITSFAIAISPYVPYYGYAPITLVSLRWMDMYINFIFILDFCVQYVHRDIRECPNLITFIYLKWYFLLALVLEIPGLNYRLSLAVNLLKVARLIRAYELLVLNQQFVSLMVRHSFIFTASIMGFFLIGGSLLLKIMEQYEQDSWQYFDNVLWFGIVTVGTVGYGDFAPVNNLSRFITVILMLVGIGLISTLSAVIVASIVTVGKSEEKKELMKRELETRWEKLKTGLVGLATPFNPMTALFYEAMGPTTTERDEKLLVTAERHKSSALNVTVGMQQKIELPVDQIMKGASGKFKVHSLGNQAELIRKASIEASEASLMKTINDHDKIYDGTVNRLTRLNYCLRRYVSGIYMVIL
jgi:hypothetical protein